MGLIILSDLFEDSEFETCGRSYFQKVAWDKSVDPSLDPKEEKEEESENRPRKLSVSDLLKKDYYRVLGLEDLKWRATEDQIRSAYIILTKWLILLPRTGKSSYMCKRLMIRWVTLKNDERINVEMVSDLGTIRLMRI